HEAGAIDHAADIDVAVHVQDGVVIHHGRQIVAGLEILETLGSNVRVVRVLGGIEVGRRVARGVGGGIARDKPAEISRVDVHGGGVDDLVQGIPSPSEVEDQCPTDIHAVG